MMSLVDSPLRFHFFRFRGKTFTLDHGESDPLSMVKPVAQCSQYPGVNGVLEAGLRYMDGKPDGHYIFCISPEMRYEKHPIAPQFLYSICRSLGIVR
jgi:hypothetical protein